MRGSSIDYSDDELAWIEARQTMPRREAHAAFCATFGRTDVSFANFKALCTRKGWKTGRTGRIEKGNIPANKGKPCPPGKGGRHPNAIATQFRKGLRQGIAIRLYKPIGTERLSKDGYLERKTNDDMPLQGRWRAVHLVEWEAVNGPIPKGHCLKCLDGNKLNTSPSNWALIPRALLPRLGGRYGFKFDAAAPEVRPSMMAVAKLKHAAKHAGSKQGTAE